MLTLIIALVAHSPAYASTSFEVKVVHEYSENLTQLRQQGTKWICDTELRKDTELKGEPEALKLFKPVKPRKSAECRSRFYAVKSSDGKKAKWEGCTDDPAVKPFLKALNKDCGR